MLCRFVADVVGRRQIERCLACGLRTDERMPTRLLVDRECEKAWRDARARVTPRDADRMERGGIERCR